MAHFWILFMLFISDMFWESGFLLAIYADDTPTESSGGYNQLTSRRRLELNEEKCWKISTSWQHPSSPAVPRHVCNSASALLSGSRSRLWGLIFSQLDISYCRSDSAQKIIFAVPCCWFTRSSSGSRQLISHLKVLSTLHNRLLQLTKTAHVARE